VSEKPKLDLAAGNYYDDTVSVLLGCGSGGLSSMISALNMAHHVRESRSWFKVRAIALGLTLVIWILLLAALFFVLVGGYFVGWFGTEHRLHPIVVFVWKAIQWPATPRRGHQIPRTMPKAPANSQAASSGKYFNGTPMSS
jgi:hypothetical protein